MENQVNNASSSEILKNFETYNTVSVTYNEDDKSSVFTFNSERRQSVDLSDFPNLLDTKTVKSESSKSSHQASKKSPALESSENSCKNESSKAKSQDNSKFGFLTDEDENLADVSSDDSESNLSKELGEKDLKAKSCCLCLIL